MTKQEEIEVGIETAIKQAVHLHTEKFGETAVQFADCDVKEATQNVKQYLHSQGVVIRAKDQGLPEDPYTSRIFTHFTYCEEGYQRCRQDMLNAGYVAVEPLILEPPTTGGVSANPPLIEDGK